MTDTYDKENHWYGHNGGECPVHPETEIEAMTVTGTLFGVCPARAVTWSHLEGGTINVIAFRITRLYREPKKPREWWVNVYPDFSGAWPTKSVADDQADSERIECVHVREVLGDDDAH
jgi:hypothetical protein